MKQDVILMYCIGPSLFTVSFIGIFVGYLTALIRFEKLHNIKLNGIIFIDDDLTRILREELLLFKKNWRKLRKTCDTVNRDVVRSGTYCIGRYLLISLTGEYRSQWPRGMRHEMFSPALTLGSWVRILIKVWMSVYSVFVLGSGLGTGWSPVEGALQTLLWLRNWSETKRFTDTLCSKVEKQD
jgi:hypothetical protein